MTANPDWFIIAENDYEDFERFVNTRDDRGMMLDTMYSVEALGKKAVEEDLGGNHPGHIDDVTLGWMKLAWEVYRMEYQGEDILSGKNLYG